MKERKRKLSRRQFIKGAAAVSATFSIVPPHVLGRQNVPPSDTFGAALIGIGSRGRGTYSDMCRGLNVKLLAECDVRFLDKADNKTIYTDFRRVLERKDIDIVAIATPPHWHALISIAAAEAGKDVMCEKPATRFIAEGRAVVEAFKRYSRIYQVCTFGRFGASRDKNNILTHKLKDYTSPVEIEAHAPPAHPEVTGMWGWVELKYADGPTLVMDSTEWGQPYDRKPARSVSVNDLSEEDRKKLQAMPDPEPLLSFAEAVKARKQSGGHAEAAQRSATILHLANIAIRTGRKIRFDPVKEQIIGDEEANRLVNVPMRAPWHL